MVGGHPRNGRLRHHDDGHRPRLPDILRDARGLRFVDRESASFAGDGLSSAFVDQLVWTPGPDLTPAEAAEVPGFTWSAPDLRGWFPIASPELNASGGHAIIHTTWYWYPPNFTQSAPLETAVTGP